MELSPIVRVLKAAGSAAGDARRSRARQRVTRANLAGLGAPPLGEQERAATLRSLRRFHPRYRNLDWHGMLTLATGRFEPGYLHEDIFYGAIEPALNPPERQRAIADKNGYARLGLPIRVPETVAHVVRGRLVDVDYEPLEREEAKVRAAQGGESEVVLKQAIGSLAGKAVRFVPVEDLPTVLTPLLMGQGIDDDWVIQRPVRQCDALAAFNPTSVNTLRVMTYRSRGGVVLVSSLLRLGGVGNRLDNVSQGGVGVGIHEGVLRPVGHSGADHLGYTTHEAHPGSGLRFAGFRVPGWQAAIEACIVGHRRIPSLDLLSWDIAIDTEEQPVLIEINTYLQSLLGHQVENGPIPEHIQDEWAERAPFRLVAGLLIRKPPQTDNSVSSSS